MTKLFQRFNACSKREKHLCFVIAFLLLALSCLICTNSHSTPWAKAEPYADPSVFQTIAMQMDNGLMPYKDTFDHKGPLLYIIEWLGYKIHHYWGIWLFEVCSVFVTLAFSYKLARLFCNRKLSLATVIVAITHLLTIHEIQAQDSNGGALLHRLKIFEAGNTLEEYVLPFIAISLYFFVKQFKNNAQSSPKEWFIHGLCAGATLVLKPNFLIIWLVFIVASEIGARTQSQYSCNEKCRGCLCIGALVITLPLMLWLALNGALYDMFLQYIVFNFKYTANYSYPIFPEGGFYAKTKTFLVFSKDALVLGSLVVSAALTYQKRDHINISYLVCLLLTLATISLSGQPHPNYAIILPPILVYPISKAMLALKKSHPLAILLLATCWLKASVPDWLDSLKDIIWRTRQQEEILLSPRTSDTTKIVEKYSSSSDAITIFGNWNAIYVLTKRLPASKYSYQRSLSGIDRNIIIGYFEDLNKNSPQVVIIHKTRDDFPKNSEEYGLMLKFLESHNYQPIREKVEDVDIYIPSD